MRKSSTFIPWCSCLPRSPKNWWTYCAASFLVLMACLWFQLQSPSNRNVVFVATIMLGSGVSILLATSLSMTADLIGRDKESSGVVYSVMRFFDRGCVALVVLIIQKNYPDSPSGVHLPACGDYARLVFTLTPAIAVFIALITVIYFFQTTVIIRCMDEANRRDENTQTVITFYNATSGSLFPVDEDDEDLTISASTPTGLPVLNKTLGELLENPRDEFSADPGPRAAFSAPDTVTTVPLRGYREDDYSMDSLAARDSKDNSNQYKEKEDVGNEKDEVYSHISSMPSTYL